MIQHDSKVVIPEEKETEENSYDLQEEEPKDERNADNTYDDDAQYH